MAKKAAVVAPAPAAEPKVIVGTMSEAIRQALTKLGPDTPARDVGEYLQLQYPDDRDLEVKVASDAVWGATVSGQRAKVREGLGLLPSPAGSAIRRKSEPAGNTSAVAELQRLVEAGLDLKAIQDAIAEVSRFNSKPGKRAVSLSEIASTIEMAESQYEELKRQTETLEKFFG